MNNSMRITNETPLDDPTSHLPGDGTPMFDQYPICSIGTDHGI